MSPTNELLYLMFSFLMGQQPSNIKNGRVKKVQFPYPNRSLTKYLTMYKFTFYYGNLKIVIFCFKHNTIDEGPN